MDYIKDMLDFISKSPTPFHAVENISQRLRDKGFIQLFEQDKWDLRQGKDYFVCRNSSSVIAFRLPFFTEKTGVSAVASHCDSPSFKIKENHKMDSCSYRMVNTERYGGMIMSTWMDRPLSVAGRIMVQTETGCEQKTVNVDRDLMIIPSLAIHMDRTVNDGKKFNRQTDLIPLLAIGETDLLEIAAQSAGVKKEDIIGHDLFLYNRQPAAVIGANNEFVCSAKLDDLQCAYSSMMGFLEAEKSDRMAVLAVFDNEEVGSETKQGAASTFLHDVLKRAFAASGDEEAYYRALAHSFMISADNAHSVHPNNPSLADAGNRPVMGGGIVIKYNANQKYTTDAVSAGIFKSMLKKQGKKWQSFANRSDMPGGSTLGNISNTKVPMATVDVGLAQLAMHSAYETASVKDTVDFIDICRSFYSTKLEKTGDDKYTVG